MSLKHGLLYRSDYKLFLFRMHAPMLAVGSNDPNTSAGGKVQIHEYNEASRSVQLFTERDCS